MHTIVIILLDINKCLYVMPFTLEHFLQLQSTHPCVHVCLCVSRGGGGAKYRHMFKVI